MKVSIKNQAQFLAEFHEGFRKKLASYHERAIEGVKTEISYTVEGSIGRYFIEHILADTVGGLPLIGPFAADFISSIPIKVYEYFEQEKITANAVNFQEQKAVLGIKEVEAIMEETAHEVARIFEQQINMFENNNDVLKIAKYGVEKIFTYAEHHKAEYKRGLIFSCNNFLQALISDEYAGLELWKKEKLKNIDGDILNLYEIFTKPGLKIEIAEGHYFYKKQPNSDVHYGFRGEIFSFDEKKNSYVPSDLDKNYDITACSPATYDADMHLVQQVSINSYIDYLVTAKEHAVSFVNYLKLSPSSQLVFRGVSVPTGSNLSYGDFSNCDMTRMSFYEVNLQHTVFTDARLPLAKFSNTNLANSWLKNTDFRWSEFEGADFSGQHTMLLDAKFDYATLGAGTDFTDNPYFVGLSKEGALVLTDKISFTTADKLQNLETIVTKVVADLNSHPPPQALEFYNVRPSLNSFIGRTKVLAEMHEHFSSNKKTVQVIAGLGGMGKTQTALRYVQEHEQDYHAQVRWIGAETKEILEENFKEFATALGLNTVKKNIKEVITFVQEQLVNKDVLLIFDNVENYDLIRAYLPNTHTSNLHHVLITTRNKGVFEAASAFTGDKVIGLEPFSIAEAVDYVHTITPYASLAEAIDLAKVFDNIPLALSQSLAYIKNNNASISDYLTEFYRLKELKLQESLQDASIEALVDGHVANIYTTLSMSLDTLTAFPKAIEILKICAYLNADDIPEYLFNSMFASELEKNKNLAILKSYSLVTLKPQAIYIHRLLQEVIQAKFASQENEILLAAAKLLTTNMYNGAEGFGTADETFQQNAPLMNHANSLLQHAKNPVERSLQEYLANLYQTCGYFYESINKTSSAIEYTQKALELTAVVYGKDHPEYAYNLSFLARISAHDKPSNIKALADVEQALSIIKNYYQDDNNAHMASQLQYLAGSYADLDRKAEALLKFQESFAIYENLYGADHPHTILVQYRVATALIQVGQNDAGLVILEQIVSKAAEKLGNNSSVVGDIYQAIGREYEHKAQYDKALNAYNASAEIFKNYQADPSKLAFVLNDIGDVYYKQQQYSQALPLYQQALAIKQQCLGVDSTSTFYELLHLGKTYFCLEEDEQAEDFFSQALARRGTLENTENIADIYFYQGEIYKKKELYEEALAQYRISYEMYQAIKFENTEFLIYLDETRIKIEEVEECLSLIKAADALAAAASTETDTTDTASTTAAHFQMPDKSHDDCCIIATVSEIIYDNALLHSPELLLGAHKLGVINELIALGAQDGEVATGITRAASEYGIAQVLEILFPQQAAILVLKYEEVAPNNFAHLPSIASGAFALKAADVGIDALRSLHQPSAYHTYQLAYGITHLYSMYNGIGEFSLLMTSSEIMQNLYHKEYLQALSKISSAAVQINLSLMVQHFGGDEAYNLIIVAYSAYSFLYNVCDFYQEVNWQETAGYLGDLLNENL